MAFTKKAKAEYSEEDRGVLFQNDKGDNENRPDLRGHVSINPKHFTVGEDGLIKVALAGWVKESPKVGQYFSLSASAPRE